MPAAAAAAAADAATDARLHVRRDGRHLRQRRRQLMDGESGGRVSCWCSRHVAVIDYFDGELSRCRHHTIVCRRLVMPSATGRQHNRDDFCPSCRKRMPSTIPALLEDIT